jgi:hypothetical protein
MRALQSKCESLRAAALRPGPLSSTLMKNYLAASGPAIEALCKVSRDPLGRLPVESDAAHEALISEEP